MAVARETTPLIEDFNRQSYGDFRSRSPIVTTPFAGEGRNHASTQTSDTTISIHPDTNTLNVRNLTCSVKETPTGWWKRKCACMSRSRRVILDNVSMRLRSGQLTAVLGTSGSGKTSLLDIISCRTPGKAKVTGDVLLRNTRMTQTMVKEHISYVMQADRLLPNLTVKETLTYIAMLKFAAGIPGFNIELQVMRVINEMGLRHVADSRIGGVISRGISGGEKRRVTIAAQLLQDPRILLLDEPTSGLDSFTAHHLVHRLSSLAKKNKIVLMTIHQPRSDIFKLIDQVVILSMGKVVYCGAASEMVGYFKSFGYPCPRRANPLDHYVDLASIDRRTGHRETETMQTLEILVQTFSKSSIDKETTDQIEEEVTQTSDEEGLATGGYSLTFSRRTPDWFSTMLTLLRRMTLNLTRDRTSFAMRNGQLAIFSLFIFLFIGHLKDTQESIQDRTGIFYETVQVPPYAALLNAVSLFTQLRDLYYRESRDGLYTSSPFLVAYFIHILPFSLIVSVLFSTITYWSIGLYPSLNRFGIYLAVVFILHYASELLAVTILAIFHNEQIVASIVSLIFVASGLIASGYLRSTESMLQIFRWMSWGTLHKYSSEIVVANEYHGLNLTCDKLDKALPCIFTNGDIYLDMFYPESVDHINVDFYALGLFTIGLGLLAMIAFKIRQTPDLN
ncbi:ATP-binding cassette sub-family G member 5-like [Lineus longissimus]|uniref:ATP-binding cassette sub-family G member 5-like n=1 Tax=Lineus longissimus TaxID=88925 RepID=UPI00315D24BA